MATDTLNGRNIVFPIYNEDGTPFHNLVLRKSVVDSIVMSLGDKITGDVFYKDNTLQVTMKEYVKYNGIHFSLVNPPTIVREGMVADNGELKGMTKYSFEFYHPMYQLSNFPFTDVATKTGEEKYLSQNKSFSWIGKPQDYIDKLNKNLQGTVWYVRKSDRFPFEKNNELSDVLTFDNVTVADAIKTGYETWDIPYVVSQLPSTDPLYAQGKRFVVEYGLPSNEIYENDSARQLDTPFVFHMGQGVGLKNNSRTPRNNKIVTRIAGYGSEDNVPYGYPQIVWTGNQDWDYTIDNDPNNPLSYPIYKGIVGGQYVKLIKHPFTRTHLMPSIFTETVNKKVNPNAVGYDPTIEIKDYYDAVATQEYPYVNEINLQAPSYESHEFADIKPELDADRNTGIVSAIPLNNDLTPADHWDDTMDDDGNYLQSYFQITLPQLTFDLYACAAITQEMQINMRSGACIGCTFPVQVDWEDYKRNFYDEDGNFVPDGQQRDLTKYPKSNLGQISVVVQKDNNTFGTLMPNIYQQPKANDLFVFIGISLPLSYITNAEERLDDAMKTYMLENNVFYFDYPLKFDEHFLATHTYILEQIRPNSIIRFDYGGVEQQLFVKQLTVKYGNAPLPQYDITLTDNIEVVLNQIGQVADDVEKLSSLIAILRQSYTRNVWNELAKKLSKVSDDTAQGFITMLKGLQIGANFVPDILGEGGVLRMRDDGKVELVTDILYARMRAYFDSVVIREYRHESGNRIKSPAQGFNASRVEYIKVVNNVETIVDDASEADYFRCYWRVDDGEKKTENQFIIGDLAFCEHSDIINGSFVTKRYWRVVRGRNSGNTTTDDGEAWIDLSNAHDTNGEPVMTTITYQGQGGTTQTLSVKSFESSTNSYPESHDDICMLGCVVDTTRQGAIIEYVSGVDAPTYQIYQGLGSDATNPYTLSNKNQIGFGYNTGTGRAYLNVYGDFRFGARPNTQGSYIAYNQQTGNLDIKANVTFTNTSEMSQFVKDNQNNYDDTEVKADIATLDATTQDLQKQIDGAIETWFMTGVPTLQNAPANEWTTDDEKDKHIGDLYYDKDTGHGYRFMYDDENEVYVWSIITDEDVAKALADAAKAQATADGKRTIYSLWNAWMKSGVNTLEEGDLFIPASDTTQEDVTYKAKKVYKCTAKGTNTFQEIDYTDDTALTTFLAGYQGTAQQLKTQIDQKAETWYQSTNPASAQGWVSSEHIGDLWYNTTNQKTYYYDGTTTTDTYVGWKQQNVPIEVFNKIDGKASIFVSQPSNYKANDLWILSADTTVNGVAYKQGEVLTSSADSATYVASHWSKKVRYTDDTYAHGFDFLTSNLARLSSTEIAGGLVLSSLIGLRDTDNLIQSGINGIIESAKKGSGIAAWYGGEQGDWEDQSNYTGVTRWAKSLFRFDGSGYLAGGNITWDKDGRVAIKDITTLISGSNTNILNELTTFNNAFHFNTQQGTTTVLSIVPQAGFTSLNITENGALKPVATQEWVSNNYVSITFFERLFKAYNGTTKVNTNSTSTIDNIKAMFGFWTEKYISALGRNDSGGGGGGASALYDLLDVQANSGGTAVEGAATGNVLTYDGNKWKGVAPSAGTVKSIKVGTTSYSPENGVVSLPAYPTLSAATASALGGIKIGYSASGTNYAVALDANDRAYVNVPWTNTWRNVYVGGTLKIGTGTGTKAFNFVGDEKTTVSFLAAGTGDGQSGNANYFTIKISSTWRGIQDNLTSTSAVDSLSAKQGKVLKGLVDTNSGNITTLQRNFTGGVANEAAKLSTVSKTLWGNTYWTSGGVPTSIGTSSSKASLNYVNNITMYGNLRLWDSESTHDMLMNWNGDVFQMYAYQSSYYDMCIGHSTAGGSALYFDASAASWGISTLTPVTKLDVNGGVKGSKFYLSKPNAENDTGAIYFELDSNNAVHLVGAGFYTDSFVSALGLNSSGGGGGGGAGDVTWDLLASNSDTRPIALSHLTTALSGYATQSWVNAKGYVTSSGVTSITAGTGLAGGTITDTGTISISSTYRTYISNGNTAYGWGNHADAGYVKSSGVTSITLKAGTGISLDVDNTAITSTGTRTITNSGVRSTTINGNYLRVNTNGTNAYLTIPYATSAAHFLAGEITSSVDSGDADTMQLNGEDTVYSVLTNYSSNNKWLNMPLSGNNCGGIVEIKGNNAYLKMQLAWAALHNEETAPTTGLWFRARANKGYVSTDWHQVAMTDSNVASATKLQTARTLWGQSFNGTANVSGAITGATTISASSNVSVGGTLDVTGATTLTGNVTFGGNLYLNNNKYVYFKDTNSTNIDVLRLTSSNNISLGYGVRTAASGTLIHGGTNGIQFRTNGTTARMFIDSAGEVGIGTTSPSHKLHVAGTFYASGNSSIGGTTDMAGSLTLNNNLKINFKNASGTAISCLTLDGSNNLVLGESMASNSYNTYVRGNNVNVQARNASGGQSNVCVFTKDYVHALVGFYSDSYVSGLGQNTSSDIRKKDIKENFAIDIDDIAAAPSVRYMWKENKALGLQVGSIAQYWQKVLPESVHEGSDGYLSMQYGVIALLASISAARKIQDHERRIKDLERENEILRKEVEQLKTA